MSIIRIAKRPRYTVIDNRLIEDNRLDYDHVGLLTYLLSKRSNWNVNILHLSKQKKTGKTKITRLLKDLQKFGYAEYKRLKTGKTEWIIHELPQTANQDKATKPQTANPDKANPDVEIRPLVITDKEVKTIKESKKEKEEKESYPENLNIQAWQLWVNHKKEKGQGYKAIGKQTAMKQLSKISHANQMLCIENSVANNYSGFFTDKYTGEHNANNNRKLTPAEQHEIDIENLINAATQSNELSMGRNDEQISFDMET